MPEIPAVTVDGVPDPLPDDVTVLDVREPVEWQHGHIDGAVHIPLTELGERLERGARTGGRSWCARWVAGPRRRWPTSTSTAATRSTCTAGMVDWADSGRPMVSETERPPHVV